MTGVLLGLLFGLGLLLIWWSFWPTTPRLRNGRGPGRLDTLRDELVHAGFPSVSVTRFLAVGFLLGLVVFAAFFALTHVASVALCFGSLAGYLPTAVVRARSRSRRTALRELWPDVVDNIGSGVRAGLALPEALAQVARRGPVELRPAFEAFAEDYRVTGRFGDCLDRLKDRLADPVADRLVESLRIARDVGGSDLGRLLRTLSAFLREDARTRAEMETRQGWTVNAARLAVAAPWIVLAMMSFRAGALQAYARPVGVVVLVTGAAITFVAYRIMLAVGRLPEEDRVLR